MGSKGPELLRPALLRRRGAGANFLLPSAHKMTALKRQEEEEKIQIQQSNFWGQMQSFAPLQCAFSLLLFQWKAARGAGPGRRQLRGKPSPAGGAEPWRALGLALVLHGAGEPSVPLLLSGPARPRSPRPAAPRPPLPRHRKATLGAGPDSAS